MDKFDRSLQRELLTYLCDIYPETADSSSLKPLIEKFGSRESFVANVLYLSEHGLVIAEPSRELGRRSVDIVESMTKITSRGIDFIRDDGGLGAILNVQTIKFHKDAVIVLEDLIAISSMNEAEKAKAKSTLGEMSTEAVKTVIQTATAALLSI